MKYKKSVLASLVLSLATVVCAKETVGVKGVKQNKKNTELLFFQQADQGSIKLIDKNTDCYRLVLDQVNRKNLYFSNTPERISGYLTNEALLTALNHNINVKGIKPNGVLNAFLVQDKDVLKEINFAGTIRNAAFNKETFSYQICPFGNQAKINIKEAKLKTIHLFVDPFHRWPP